MERCNQCQQQPLIEIDNRGERLTGCLTRNLWALAAESGGRGFPRKTSTHFTICDIRQRNGPGIGAGAVRVNKGDLNGGCLQTAGGRGAPAATRVSGRSSTSGGAPRAQRTSGSTTPEAPPSLSG
jgi:hypothetical protein